MERQYGTRETQQRIVVKMHEVYNVAIASALNVCGMQRQWSWPSRISLT